MSSEMGGAVSSAAAMLAEQNSFDAASIMVSANPMASGPDVKVHFTQKLTQSSLLKNEELATQKSPVKNLQANIKGMLNKTPLFQVSFNKFFKTGSLFNFFDSKAPAFSQSSAYLKSPVERYTPLKSSVDVSEISKFRGQESLGHYDIGGPGDHRQKLQALDDFIYVMMVQFKSNTMKSDLNSSSKGEYVPMNSTEISQPELTMPIDSVNVSQEVSDDLLGLMQEFLEDKNGNLQELFHGKALPGSDEFKALMSQIYSRAENLQASQQFLYHKFLNAVFGTIESTMLNQNALPATLGEIRERQAIKDPFLAKLASKEQMHQVEDIFAVENQSEVFQSLADTSLTYMAQRGSTALA